MHGADLRPLMGDPLIKYVAEQLPRRVRDQLSVIIQADAYHLRSRALFKTKDGREFECDLETMMLGTAGVACQIPETFVAHLCAVL